MELGIDVFVKKYLPEFRGLQIGLVTNATGVNSDLRRNIDLFLENGLKVVKLFGPEHGVFGTAPDGEKLSDFIDPKYGIPVYSLYGEKLRPTEDMLKGIDVLVYDIQDVGLRFYTYIYTMIYCMEECAKYGVRFVVLDRPDPLSCKIEGPVVKKEFESFVGGYGLALRYGMTPGELAKYVNAAFRIGADLCVIEMEDYEPSLFYDEAGLLWNTPSPNLPSLEHTILYEGFCLLEGVNVSVGRGTVHPFKYIGAPWIDSERFYREIKKLSPAGVVFRERVFLPAAFKLQNKPCYGLEFFVTDRREIKPLHLAVDVISTLRRIHPYDFRWDSYFHGDNERYHFDLLIGDDFYRKAIEDGALSKDFEQIWESESEQFENIIGKFRIY